MERAEAEAIYDAGRDAVVDALLAQAATADRLAAQLEEVLQVASKLAARVEELELEVARLKSRSSRNTSLPPSQDPPGMPPRRSRGTGTRKRGGQPGREGSHRR